MPDDTQQTPASEPSTPAYSATPLTGPTVAYTPPPSATQTPTEVRPRRRRGLLIGGIVAAGVLVLAGTFGGGVALGAHLGPVGPGSAFEQSGFPGGQDGERPGPPDGFRGGPGEGVAPGEGGAPGQQDGDSTDGSSTDEGSTDGSSGTGS